MFMAALDTHAYTHTCTYAHFYPFLHSHSQARSQTQPHTHIHELKQNTNTHIYTNLDTHTVTSSHTHTHTDTHIQQAYCHGHTLTYTITKRTHTLILTQTPTQFNEGCSIMCSVEKLKTKTNLKYYLNFLSTLINFSLLLIIFNFFSFRNSFINGLSFIKAHLMTNFPITNIIKQGLSKIVNS